jgi:integrase
LYRLFKHYCEKAGATQFLTPHSARATAITKLLADGIPHREVQEFSRHSSIQMVELYDKRRLTVEENPGKELDYE